MQGKRELDADVPEEVREELRQMWEGQGHSLRVYCANQNNGTRIDGIFRVVDGKKKIEVADGSLVDPVVFERSADRTTTRNWQISVLVEGERVLLARVECVRTEPLHSHVWFLLPVLLLQQCSTMADVVYGSCPSAHPSSLS